MKITSLLLDDECVGILDTVGKEKKGRKSEFVRRSIKHYYSTVYANKKMDADVEEKIKILEQKTKLEEMKTFFTNVLKGDLKAIKSFSARMREFWNVDPEFIGKMIDVGNDVPLQSIDVMFDDACKELIEGTINSHSHATSFRTLLEARFYPRSFDEIITARKRGAITHKVVRGRIKLTWDE